MTSPKPLQRGVTEVALKQREKELSALLNATRDHAYLMKPDGTLLAVNQNFAEGHGRDASALVGTNVYELLPASVATVRRQLAGQLLASGRSFRFEDQVEECVFEHSLYPVFGDDQEVEQVAVFSREITQQRQAMEALQRSEQRYRLLAENATDIIWSTDMSFNLTYCSPAVERMRGYPPAEVMTHSLEDIFTPEGVKLCMEAFAEEFQLEQASDKDLQRVRTLETEQKRKDGSLFWAEMKLRFLRDSQQRPMGILGITRDITERRQATEALRESEARFRGFFELSPQAIAISEATSGRLLEVNDVFCEQLQYTREELIGRTTLELELFPEEDRRAFLQSLRRSGDVRNLEMDLRVSDGSLLHSLVSARILAAGDLSVILTVIVDMTLRKQLEVQLQQSQKMEAIGNLAGGVAHDMNNILAAIMGLASVLQVDAEPESTMMEDIKGILTACRRGSDLTHNLLGFARQGKYRKEPISINGLIMKVQELLSRTIPKGIALRAELDPSLSGIEGDPVQINQVLVNLAINAVDAMGEEGTLTFRTFNATLEEGGELQVAGLPPGRYVACEVIDTGAGMDERTRQHAFEPFFTTKATGEGTGLGLSMVYGTIKNHGGQVILASETGQGAAFTIYLPALESRAKDSESSGTWEAVAPQWGGTILLVDDEELVRTSGRRLLEKLGYKVLLAENGEVALTTYNAHKQEISLVILDLIMPVMSGVETFRKLQAIDPQVRVLSSSGYSRQRITDQLFDLGVVGFIQKPYTLKKLSGEVSRALAPKKPSEEASS